MSDLMEALISNSCFVPTILLIAIIIVPSIIGAGVYLFLFPFKMIESIFGGKK